MAQIICSSNKAMLSVSFSDMFMNAVRFFKYSFFYGWYYFARSAEECKALI